MPQIGNNMFQELNKKFAEISTAIGIGPDTVAELYYNEELTEILTDLIEKDLISHHLLDGL